MPPTVQTSVPLSLKVYSLNTKGLNIPEKRSSVLAEVHRHRAQVVFLQETHFKLGSIPRLSNSRFPEVFHATCADSKTKGVSILLAKSFVFHLTDQVRTEPLQLQYTISKGSDGAILSKNEEITNQFQLFYSKL